MTVFKNIIIDSEVNGFSTRFLRNYDLVSPSYPNDGLIISTGLLACWAQYPDKSIQNLLYIDTATETLLVAIGKAGLLATAPIPLSTDNPDLNSLTWTNRTSTLTALSGGSLKKINASRKLAAINGTPNDSVILIGGEGGFCAYTRNGTNWFALSEFTNVSTKKIDWATVSQILLGIAVKRYSNTDPYFTFFNEIPATQSYRRGDINNNGVITASDAATTLRYSVGLEVNSWAKTHIQDYLITNYNTLSQPLKDLVGESEIWLTTQGNNDIVDITGDLTSLTVLGGSGQLAHLVFNNSSYFCRIESLNKDKIKDCRYITRSILNNTQQTSVTFIGTVYFDQGNASVARINLSETGASTDYLSIGMNSFVKMSGTASIGTNLATVISIIDKYNFLIFIPVGTKTAGSITFYTTAIKANYILSTIDKILVSSNCYDWTALSQTITSKNTGVTIALNPGNAIISTQVYNPNTTNRTPGVLIPCSDNNYVSTANLVDFYIAQKSNNQVIPQNNLKHTVYTSKNPTGADLNYLIMLSDENTSQYLNVVNISNNTLENIEVDMSLPISNNFQYSLPTSINTLIHFSSTGAIGVETTWIVVGTSAGELVYCIVRTV